MKKLMMTAVLAALALGCGTVRLSSPGSMDGGERLLVIQNDGYMLLGVVPLASGRMTGEPAASCRFSTPAALFSNHADTRRLYAMAVKIAERERCDLRDVEFIDNSTQLDFSCAYGIVTHDDVALSAVLVPRR